MAADGGLYVQDIGSRVFLWKSGRSCVVAGSGTVGYADGPAAQARFVGHGGLAVLPRARSSSRTRATTGSGSSRRARSQHSPATGAGRRPREPSALMLPSGLAVGADGKVYVAEAGNGTVRVLTP